jgi:hypothetical protein
VKQERVIQDFAPSSAKDVLVQISDMDGEVPSTKIEFTAQTPEGKIAFHSYITAIDMFGSAATLTAAQSLTFVDKDMAVRDPNVFPGHIQYNDANLGLNPVRLSAASVSTKLRTDGTAAVVYESSCSLQISKK